MAIDAATFRHTLAQFASGVTVVTTRDAAGRPLGLTVSSFCSVSLEPPLVLVCIDARSDVHPGFRESGRFGVSVLAEGQEDVSQHFAWGGAEKFEGRNLHDAPHGSPLVPGGVAWLECRVEAAHAAGDHVVYVGLVEHSEVREGRPLLYHRGAYRRLDAAGEAPPL